jgi:hypothetical protein
MLRADEFDKLINKMREESECWKKKNHNKNKDTSRGDQQALVDSVNSSLVYVVPI